jgi:hypothetical protein
LIGKLGYPVPGCPNLPVSARPDLLVTFFADPEKQGLSLGAALVLLARRRESA